jgi:hypothetical protein
MLTAPYRHIDFGLRARACDRFGHPRIPCPRCGCTSKTGKRSLSNELATIYEESMDLEPLLNMLSPFYKMLKGDRLPT